MQYIQQYMNLYPEDETVIKGGAAAHLQLRQCGFYDPIKDIDVSVRTWKRKGQERARRYEILDRWTAILPKLYTHNYDINNSFGVSPAIVTFTDQTGQELHINVFINQENHPYIEEVEGFNVVSFDTLITNY